MTDHVMTLRLDPDLAERLRVAAFVQRRPQAAILRDALIAHLDAAADSPIDRIPTAKGREAVNGYRAHRTEQHPHGGGPT